MNEEQLTKILTSEVPTYTAPWSGLAAMKPRISADEARGVEDGKAVPMVREDRTDVSR